MTFDPTISFGAILNAIALSIGFVVAFTRLGGRLDLLTQRLETLEGSLKESRSVEKRVTITEERVTNHGRSISVLQRDVSSLRRGEGWIANRRESVDGEYGEGE